MASELPRKDFPLFIGKSIDDENRIYLCKNYACQKPVSTIESLKAGIGLNNIKKVQ